jgi:hypothetical protein
LVFESIVGSKILVMVLAVVKGKNSRIATSTPPGIENLGATCHLNTQIAVLGAESVLDGIPDL